MAAAALTKSVAVSTLTRNNALPFIKGNALSYQSPGAAVMYGVNSPGSGSATKYQRFQQTLTGNKHFLLSSGINTPQNTTGGALSDLNQLRVVALVNDAVTAAGRARGDQVVPTNAFIVAAGGGTAVADATLSIKGTTASALLVGSTSMSIASSGADTQTILVGDRITVATSPGTADATVYYATATSTALNGTTEVLVPITPPLQVAKVATQVVTIAAASGKGIIFNQTIAVGSKVEVWVNDAADITQITGGTFTANIDYQAACFDVTWNTSAALVNLERL
jgi:hypothetical protein